MRRNGFTLLEAMVALAILSLVGVAALGAVSRDLEAASRAQTALESSALAEDRLELIRLLDAGTLHVLPDSLARGRFPPPFDDYGWEAEVDPVFGRPGLYRVRVEVTWADGRRALAGFIHRRPARVAP
ncbi:MAG TPA: type II secretion system protein [Longimicrobiales bacterium]|nr:type II secretion system protein [Longimicrobiales bacterium]